MCIRDSQGLSLGLEHANARLDQTTVAVQDLRLGLEHANDRLDQTVLGVRGLKVGLEQTVDRLDQTVLGVQGLKVGFDQANSRLEAIETAVLEFAEQQRFVVRYLRTLTERDRGIDEDVLDLRRRVEQIEARLGPG